jgi:hypothetical protein
VQSTTPLSCGLQSKGREKSTTAPLLTLYSLLFWSRAERRGAGNGKEKEVRRKGINFIFKIKQKIFT